MLHQNISLLILGVFTATNYGGSGRNSEKDKDSSMYFYATSLFAINTSKVAKVDHGRLNSLVIRARLHQYTSLFYFKSFHNDKQCSGGTSEEDNGSSEVCISMPFNDYRT